MADAGYGAPRLTFLLRALPLQILAWMRADRVLRRAIPPEPSTGPLGRIEAAGMLAECPLRHHRRALSAVV
ncbi:hypothetical protein [Streptomyces olivaceoviridis]